MAALTADVLASQPRWENARLVALPGRCRGDVMSAWGDNLAKRFGPTAVPRIRARLDPSLGEIRAVLTKTDWVPMHAQVMVTNAIVDEFLGGDLTALLPLLLEDMRANLSRFHRMLARSLGVGRTIKIMPKVFRKVYDRGTAEVAVEGRRARMSFAENAVFSNPTWRVLQLYAVRTLFDLTDTAGAVVGEDTGSDSFATLVSW